MKLQTVNSCLNCENLIRDFICKKHNQTVAMNNFVKAILLALHSIKTHHVQTVITLV